MKVFTIFNSCVTAGARLDSFSICKPTEERTLRLGDYSANATLVPMFRKNVPEIDISERKPYGIITDAYPVKVDGGYALAKPNQENDEILVVIQMGRRERVEQGVKVGTWSFDFSTVPASTAIKQTLAQGTGSALFENEIGWHDALVIMKVGDSLTLHERNGDIARVKYESVEAGLVVDTRVRMILQDYDAAPDGVGLYTKLDSVFPSRKAALDYRSRYMADMYWGKIETLDGTLIRSVEEHHEQRD
jgi:hypothetical protein